MEKRKNIPASDDLIYQFFDDDENVIIPELKSPVKDLRIDKILYQDFETRTPLFSYDYIDLEGDFSFLHENSDQKDFHHYFKALSAISKKPLAELRDGIKDLHFHKVDLTTKVREIFLKKFGSRVDDSDPPALYQIGLYTEELVDEPESKSKAPRVFFLLGNWSIFYVIFFDPYHEILKHKPNEDRNNSAGDNVKKYLKK